MDLRALSTALSDPDFWDTYGRYAGSVLTHGAIDPFGAPLGQQIQQKFNNATQTMQAGLHGDQQAALSAALGMELGSMGSGMGNVPPKAVATALAYHGTPHTFDRFDLSKIGTGEGAQAYGHGLYFAGNPATAKAYQGALSEVSPSQRIAKQLIESGATPEQAITELNVRANRALENRDAEVWQNMMDAQKHVRQGTAKGNLYRADLPDDHELLDWDKPLSEQPEGVKKALAAGWLAHPEAHAQMTGEKIYKATVRDAGSPEAASSALAQVGIPGLRYLDQGSRGAGQGTHNYVIWDESRIKHLGATE